MPPILSQLWPRVSVPTLRLSSPPSSSHLSPQSAPSSPPAPWETLADVTEGSYSSFTQEQGLKLSRFVAGRTMPALVLQPSGGYVIGWPEAEASMAVQQAIGARGYLYPVQTLIQDSDIDSSEDEFIYDAVVPLLQLMSYYAAASVPLWMGLSIKASAPVVMTLVVIASACQCLILRPLRPAGQSVAAVLAGSLLGLSLAMALSAGITP